MRLVPVFESEGKKIIFTYKDMVFGTWLAAYCAGLSASEKIPVRFMDTIMDMRYLKTKEPILVHGYSAFVLDESLL